MPVAGIAGMAATAASGVAEAGAKNEIAKATNDALATIQLDGAINKKGNEIMTQNAV